MIIVDRIEEGFAVVYFGDEKRVIPLSELPEGVREGSVLKQSSEGFVLDPEAEAERRKHISQKMRRLFK